MIQALDRKLLRDLAQLRTQAIAIALVVASGVALFLGTGDHLPLAPALGSALLRGPALRRRMGAVSRVRLVRIAATSPRSREVAAVEGRLVSDVVLDVPGLDEPATGLIVSIPPRTGHPLNDVYVRRGRHVEAGRPGEVLVSEAFAETESALARRFHARHARRPADRAAHRRYGAQSRTGDGHSAGRSLAPDDRRYGVFWMEEAELARLLRMPDAINEVAIRLATPARRRPP